jgi:hypothetical protein
LIKSKALRDWEYLVRDKGPIVPGPGPYQLHHVYGRTYKHNKVLIGPWYVILLPWHLHDVASNDENNVTHYPKRFAQVYGFQRDLFLEMCDSFVTNGIILPFGQEVIQAISLTAR